MEVKAHIAQLHKLSETSSKVERWLMTKCKEYIFLTDYDSNILPISDTLQ